VQNDEDILTHLKRIYEAFAIIIIQWQNTQN